MHLEPQPLIDGKPINFAGWVMITEFAPGVLLMTDIFSYTGQPMQCENDICHAQSGRGMPFYLLESEENEEVLCQRHVEALYRDRAGRDYLIGALPAS